MCKTLSRLLLAAIGFASVFAGPLTARHAYAFQDGRNQPVTSQPITSQPITSQPITSQPITSQPITCRPWQYGNPDLFYNFYTQGQCNTVNAQLYIAPQPVPPFVGHTFYTYQPLYPHEYLHHHHQRYHRYYDDGRGLNRTYVKWYHPPVRSGLADIRNYLQIAR